MLARGGLKGLGGHHQPDVEHDRHAGFDRHQLAHQAEHPQQAAATDQQPVQPGVADTGSHRLPAGVADVEAGGEARPQRRGGHAADAVDQQGAAHRVVVAGGGGAFDVLQRTQHVEQTHRHDHPQPGQQLAAALPEAGQFELGQSQPHLGRFARPDPRVDLNQAAAPGQGDAHEHGQQAAGDRQLQASVVRHQDHRQHRQAHHRLGIGAQQKAEADVPEGDARQGGEQGGSGQPASQQLGAEGTAGFDQAGAQTGHHARLPREAHGGGLIEALTQSGELHRQHHQEHVGEQAHRVDAVRQGGAVAPALPLRQLVGLPGVGEVAHDQADAGGRQDRAEQERVRVPEHAAAEGEDQQDLDQVVQPQAQEAVHIAGYEPAGSGVVARLCHGCDPAECFPSSAAGSAAEWIRQDGNPLFTLLPWKPAGTVP